jgi:GH25 family lysozyme M1 (1,4-beta-N-acetylmuramidase)
MGKIADVSHHNGTIDWAQASKELDLAIIRVQYGSNKIDNRYKEYTEGCKTYNIPFGHYAYARFVSVRDAITEADDFMNRADPDAKFLVVDVEEVTTRNPSDITVAIQAFIDTCRTAGWKTGLYTGHHFYYPNKMNTVHAEKRKGPTPSFLYWLC